MGARRWTVFLQSRRHPEIPPLTDGRVGSNTGPAPRLRVLGASSDGGDGEIAELRRGVRSLGSAAKQTIGATYGFLFDRPQWQRGIISLVLFLLAPFVEERD